MDLKSIAKRLERLEVNTIPRRPFRMTNGLSRATNRPKFKPTNVELSRPCAAFKCRKFISITPSTAVSSTENTSASLSGR